MTSPVIPEKLSELYDLQTRGEYAKARDVLTELIGEDGRNAFGLCIAMASVAKNGLKCGCGDPDCKPGLGKTWQSNGVLDTRTNTMLIGDDMPSHVRFAADFITAYANGNVFECCGLWHRLNETGDGAAVGLGIIQLLGLTAPYAFSIAMQRRMEES